MATTWSFTPLGSSMFIVTEMMLDGNLFSSRYLRERLPDQVLVGLGARYHPRSCEIKEQGFPSVTRNSYHNIIVRNRSVIANRSRTHFLPKKDLFTFVCGVKKITKVSKKNPGNRLKVPQIGCLIDFLTYMSIIQGHFFSSPVPGSKKGYLFISRKSLTLEALNSLRTLLPQTPNNS